MADRRPNPLLSWLTYAVARTVMFFFSIPSWETADRLGTALGVLAYRLGIRRGVVMENLEFVFASEKTPPDRRKSPEELQRIARATYANFGRVVVNYLRIFKQDDRFWAERTRCKNPEVLREALKRGKGAMVLVAHMGGWEMGTGIAAHQDWPSHIIVKRIANPVLNDLVNKGRRFTGVNPIPAKDSRDAIVAALDRNEVICLVFDQSMTHRQGIYIDFFGRPATAIKSTAGIVRDTGTAILGGANRRIGPGRYELVFYPEIPWVHHEDFEKARLINTQNYSRFIERVILEKPEDWFWLHRRWKIRGGSDEAVEEYRRRVEELAAEGFDLAGT
ncbi:MAG: lysophospholipid acyltransferase family protein [Deltaproteobacteria bacterium]|nr:lysophospholipid acyltransferase family protein [Deltaproteobacteria bacterium]